MKRGPKSLIKADGNALQAIPQTVPIMFSSLILALSISSIALAGPTKLEGLKIKLSGPSAIESVEDLKLTAVVSNTGAEDIRAIKYGTILDNALPTRSFSISKDGVSVPFTGVKVNRRVLNGSQYKH